MTSRSRRLAPHLLELARRHAVRADDERAALDLVGEVGGADAAVGEVGLDAGVVDQLAEGGDLLPLVAGVLGLVDRQAHAIAEAGALGDTDLRRGAVLIAPILSVRGPYRPFCQLGKERSDLAA